MKKTKISIIVTSFILLVSMMFTMVSCTTGKTPSIDDESEAFVETTALSTHFVNTENVKLMAASPMMNPKAATITQKITATVFPENATNKNVDWSVAWADAGNSENVSNYLTVTPDSDGSTSATVTCKGAFTGDIVITATTRQNGYKADCIVSFVGVPANINIVTDLTPESDGYHVVVGSTYTFGTELSNPFGEVGNAYKNLQVSVKGVGTIKVAGKEVSVSSGKVTWYDDNAKNISMNDIASEFVEAFIATDGTVTVNVLKSIESYYDTFSRIDGGRTQYYTDCFKEYVTDCYFEIVLTEHKSGVSSSFNVVIDPNAVTGVTVEYSEMFF